MKMSILREAGLDEALLGLSLSHQQPVDGMMGVACRLATWCDAAGGELKFLESIVVWLDVTAPRYWGQQFDTYRVGVTKQSASTMHTILRRPLSQGDFAMPIPEVTLARLNERIAALDFAAMKNELPEGFLQRRIVCTNYKALRHMFRQRRDHRLPEWREFCAWLVTELQHPVFLMGENNAQEA
jgi:hypothetical protein